MQSNPTTKVKPLDPLLAGQNSALQELAHCSSEQISWQRSEQTWDSKPCTESRVVGATGALGRGGVGTGEVGTSTTGVVGAGVAGAGVSTTGVVGAGVAGAGVSTTGVVGAGVAGAGVSTTGAAA